MNLTSIADSTRTDKNTTHSYLELYDQLLVSRKTTAEHVLEIGIGPADKPNGGSIRMWHDYFDIAQIHALDIIPPRIRMVGNPRRSAHPAIHQYRRIRRRIRESGVCIEERQIRYGAGRRTPYSRIHDTMYWIVFAVVVGAGHPDYRRRPVHRMVVGVDCRGSARPTEIHPHLRFTSYQRSI